LVGEVSCAYFLWE